MNFELPCKIQVLITCVAHGLCTFSLDFSSNRMCRPCAMDFLVRFMFISHVSTISYEYFVRFCSNHMSRPWAMGFLSRNKY